MSTYDPVSDRTKYPEMIHFREWVEKFRYFLFWDTKILRSPDRNKHEELGPSGEHLAPVLALLKQRHPDRFDKLKKRIQRLFPHVADISISGGKTSWGWRTIRIHERDGQKEVAFNSQQTSDGVLRLLAVASLLFLDKVPSLVMFEEPENGMNPQLLREIVSILRELTLKKWPKQCQVIFTTHSPYVLDEFYDYPKEVFIMGRASAKHGATLHSLDSASQLNKVRETFTSLGEAWFSGLFNEGMLGKAG
jgi:predicted ATPase